jgi:hypothetical protein
MRGEEKTDTSNWMIGFGERVQELQNLGPVNLAVKAVAGSSSPNYIQATWRPVNELLDCRERAAEFPGVPADTEASLLTIVLPRLKKKASIVGTKSTTFSNFLKANKEGQAAVGFTYNEKTHAGVLPNGLDDLKRLYYVDKLNPLLEKDRYEAAVRLGRTAFQAGIGVYFETERTLVLPSYSYVVKSSVSIDELPPKVPLV